MKDLNLSQPFNDYLVETLKFAKAKRNITLARMCNALISNSNYFAEKTVRDVLETESKSINAYRNTGPKGYVAFCRTFLGTSIKLTGFKFFKEYFLLQKKNRKKEPGTHPPKVTIKAVKVRTDPETTVFEIKVDGGKKVGIWKETANTTSETNFFLKGLQAMNCFGGFPMLHLPAIPKVD